MDLNTSGRINLTAALKSFFYSVKQFNLTAIVELKISYLGVSSSSQTPLAVK